MTNTTPLPTQPIANPTWKDRLTPSWPAVIGMALTTIGVFNALDNILMFAVKCNFLDVGVILPMIAIFIPTVLLLIAGIQLLMRTHHARIYCLLYAWVCVGSKLLFHLKYMIRYGSILNPTIEMLFFFNELLLPAFLILWLSWEPVKREIRSWNPDNHNCDESAKYIGWHKAMGWIAIAIGLTKLARTLSFVIYNLLTTSDIDLKTYVLDAGLVLPCLAFSGIVVSGLFLLTQDRAGASLMLVATAGALITIGYESFTYYKDMWLNTHGMFNFLEPLAKILGQSGASVFLFWWFCRPSVWCDMAAWEKPD